MSSFPQIAFVQKTFLSFCLLLTPDSRILAPDSIYATCHLYSEWPILYSEFLIEVGLMMKQLLPLKYLAELMGAAALQNPFVQGVCVDSRLLEEGNLFFALPGAQTDGHQYLAEAAFKGAPAAVVKKGYQGEHFGLALIHVDDVLQALQCLTINFLKSSRAKIIAVTGSMGKTTTKDFIASLLKDKFRVSSSPGNSNSQIGLPLAILNHVNEDDEVIVLEMGMTHPGNLSRLVKIAPPDIALMTAVALVHAGNFSSLEEIGCAKAEIFSHPKTQVGIFHHDISNKEDVKSVGQCQKMSFSINSKEADWYSEIHPDGVQIYEHQTKAAFLPPLSIPGVHNNHNFLAAAVVARVLNMSWEEILARYPFLNLPERRLQFIEKDGILFVNDSYNASEVTVKAALQSLPQPKKGGKKVAVIGEMLELGKFSEQCHWEVGRYALQHVDWMLCLGPACAPIHACWKEANRPVVWENERSVLVSILRAQLQPGDVILLKGSRLKQLWKILEEL